MLTQVQPKRKSFSQYKQFINTREYLSIKEISKKCSNLKVVHINSTSAKEGGGVAQMLTSLIPLFNSLGVKSEWYSFLAPEKFFEITKKIHNSLQGSKQGLTETEKKYYISINKKLAKEIDKLKCDILVVHDPQPLAAIYYCKKLKSIKKIIRIHIDLSKPNKDSFNFVRKYFEYFDRILLSSFDYINRGLDYNKIVIIYPAIDPLAIKNIKLTSKEAKKIISNLGIDVTRPIICQVSRLDPFKDPIGVIDVYRQLKKKIKNLQLVLMGVLVAKDDPEAIEILQKVIKHKQDDKDIHLFYDINQLKNYDIAEVVNALQTVSDVVLQKSLREGFGLTVTEAMWKTKPVVAGNVGGIRLQITDGRDGFLINNKKQAVLRSLELFNNKDLNKKMGQRAKRAVRRKFLITRLIHDYLKLFESLS